MYKFIILIAFSLYGFVVNAQLANPPAEDQEIAFVSDTQAPMWIETLWLKKHNNKTTTRELFEELSARKPSALFLLGDVVNLGYSNRQWRPMDGYLQNLRENGVSVHAALGNHEVMGQAKKGIRKFQQRFPDHVPTGYVVVRDSVAIVLLNSNFNKLSKEQDDQQVAWYKETLNKLDADPAIHFIISGCHHSPYTNSKIVGSSSAVQQRFVPAFIASVKSRLFISGHCHGFEHYKMSGKDFIVIGGGGGLHQPLKTGTGALPDLATDYKPLFHYLTVRRGNNQLNVTSYWLRDNFNGFDAGLAFKVNGSNEPDIATRADASVKSVVE